MAWITSVISLTHPPTHPHTDRLTKSGAVSGSGQAASVAVCEDGDGVSRHSRQDVLGTIVTNLPVIIHISFQHLLNPTNYAAEGQRQEVRGQIKGFGKLIMSKSYHRN